MAGLRKTEPEGALTEPALMPVPARSFRFQLGGGEVIGPNRARPRWLTERIAPMGKSPHDDPIRKNENAGLSWPAKKTLKAAVERRSF